MKSFLLLALVATLTSILQAQEIPIDFKKPISFVSTMPDHPVLVESNGRCAVSTDPKAEPVWFRVVPGIVDRKFISLEAVAAPGSYLRHSNWRVFVQPFNEDDESAAIAATFKLIVNSDGTYSLEAVSNPNCYLAVLPANIVRFVANPDSQRRSFLLKTE
jgi:hypothetical protein